MPDFSNPVFTGLFSYASIAAIGLGIFILVLALVGNESSVFWKYWGRYTSSLERKLRPMFIFTKGSTIALGQLGAAFALVLANIVIGVPYWILGLAAIAAGPTFYVNKLRQQRIDTVDKQLDNFIMALANALKTTPNIGAAFATILNVIQDPLRQETELALREMRVGSTLDQALLHMASRVGSKQLDSALSSVLIGRQVGGNMPKVLETTAQTIREMSRLEGIIRTKTAEGKMQLGVLAALPAILILVLNYFSPGYFDPLTKDMTGYTILLICAGLWGGAFVWALQILNVDI